MNHAWSWPRELDDAVLVRCLRCGARYEKPRSGGMLRENPGCPRCGYLGWADVSTPLPTAPEPRRFDADPPRPTVGRSH